jgi:peptidyl-tRNA hydrolase, PTH1 family
MGIKLIVGLGNIGKEYEKTRHNVGFLFIDYLLEKYEIIDEKEDFFGKYYKIKVGSGFAYLGKPYTLMNLSGQFVLAMTNFFKIYPQNILVVYDDISFQNGEFKIKKNGSSGGQKGIENIIKRMGTEKIKRFKIGIGKDERIPMPKYVLGKITRNEMSKLKSVFKCLYEAATDFLEEEEFDKIMSIYNGRRLLDE